MNPIKGTFTVENKADSDQQRKEPCLANVRNEFIVVIGGLDFWNNRNISSVSRYQIAGDKWEGMPALNEARRSASACYVGGYVYVMGGLGVNTIERLDVTASSNARTAWELIQPEGMSLSPLYRLAFVPISCNEIVILGEAYDDKSANN